MLFYYIKEAWKAYKRNFSQFVLSFILFYVIIFMTIGLFLTLLFGSMSNIPDIETEEQVLGFMSAILFGTSPIVLLIALILLLLETIGFNLGLVKMSYDSLKGKTSWKVILPTAKKHIITGLKAFLIVLVILTLSFATVIAAYSMNALLGIIFYVLALVILLHFLLVQQAIVIDGLGAVESVVKSTRIIRGNFVEFIKIIIFQTVMSGVVGFAGFILPILMLLNTFVLTPLFLVMCTKFYTDNRTARKNKKYPKLRRVSKRGRSRKKRF